MSVLRKEQHNYAEKSKTLTATSGNWDQGNLVTLTTNPGSNNYTCTNIQNNATAIFLYNSAGIAHDTKVTVLTSNEAEPQVVTVPGTTSNQGLATIVLVNGAITNTVSITMTPDQASDSQVQAVIVSQAFPINTAGINNIAINPNGQKNTFSKFTRFYSVPAGSWYQLMLQSNVNQFFCAQFGLGGDVVSVYCLNPGPNAAAQVVQADPANPVSYKFIVPTSGQPQTITTNIFGNGQQVVWMNADSLQDSQSATIALTPLG